MNKYYSSIRTKVLKADQTGKFNWLNCELASILVQLHKKKKTLGNRKNYEKARNWWFNQENHQTG